MSGNRGEKIKEVVDDVSPTCGLNTERDKGVKSIPRHVGLQLANAEKLIDIPGDNTIGQPTPAPFDYTAKNGGLRQSELLSECPASVVMRAFFVRLKEVAYECSAGHGIALRTEG